METRNQSMRDRFFELYNTDFLNEGNYQLVIQTDLLKKIEIIKQIIDNMLQHNINSKNLLFAMLIKNITFQVAKKPFEVLRKKFLSTIHFLGYEQFYTKRDNLETCKSCNCDL